MAVLGPQGTSSWEYSRGLSILVYRYLAEEVLWMRHCCWVFRVLVAIGLCDRIGPLLTIVLEFYYRFVPSEVDCFCCNTPVLDVVLDAV